MRAEVKIVTPEMATTWLENNTNNRPALQEEVN